MERTICFKAPARFLELEVAGDELGYIYSFFDCVDVASHINFSL